MSEISISKGPSEHLSWTELACKDGTPYPDTFIKDGRIFDLAVVFEDIRNLWKKPIIIHSAYRTHAHNLKIGGANDSQHLHGRALDISPPNKIDLDTFYITIKRNAFEFGIKGLGLYKTFVHVDIRLNTTRLVTWSGIGAKDSLT